MGVQDKFKANSTLERLKASWVLPVWLPVQCYLWLSRSWSMHQLHGTLSETVYCAQPAGFGDSVHPDYVCRLNHSLYALKQAPRAWYSRFASYMLKLSFVEAKTDTSHFVYHSGGDMVCLLLYVDDIIFTTSSTTLLRRTMAGLQ